jgi:hypothetical protein
MALDPSIILQAGRGVTPLLSPTEIQDQQMQRELGGMKLSQLRQGMQDDAAQREIARSTAPEGLAGAYYKAGLIKPAQEAVKFQTEQQKAAREAEKAKYETALKQYEIVGQVLGTVRDQASYDAGRQQLQAMGIPTPNAPPQYDPNVVQQFQQQAMSAKDQVAQKWKAMEYTTPTAAAVLGAETSRSNNAATIANSQRTADMTDARAREFNATKVEDNRIKREAQGTGVKLTEDQGKATGWLVQAENAFKNMQAAGFDRDGNPTSAAKPGVADAIAGVPLVGGAVGNWLRTPDRQKFVQGASSLSESLLRAATGAGVNKDEAKQKIEELTPQWGEDVETTKQKMAAIPLYIESLKVRAGPGAPKAQEISATSPRAVGVPKKAAGVARPADKAAFDALPSGTLFIDPNGVTRRKP